MLSEQIKKARQKAFLSQDAFAKELGVAYSTINRWETGKSKPNLSAMKASFQHFPVLSLLQDLSIVFGFKTIVSCLLLWKLSILPV